MARKQAGQHKSKSKTDGSLERWNTYDDIPDDEQDAFHHQQDKIALGDLNGKAAVDDDEYGEYCILCELRLCTNLDAPIQVLLEATEKSSELTLKATRADLERTILKKMTMKMTIWRK